MSWNFRSSSKDTTEAEADPPYDRRFFKRLFGKEIYDYARASVFVERFKPGAESFPHCHVPPEVEIFFGLRFRNMRASEF